MDAFEYDPIVNDPANYDDDFGGLDARNAELAAQDEAEYQAWLAAAEAEQAALDAYADAYYAQYDDDPNPYHGDYSEM